MLHTTLAFIFNKITVLRRQDVSLLQEIQLLSMRLAQGQDIIDMFPFPVEN